MTLFRRSQARLLGSQLMRAGVAALLVFLAGALIYRLIGLNAVGAILFAVACGAIRLLHSASRPERPDPR